MALGMYIYICIYITDSPWLIAHMLHNIFKIIVCVLCKYMNGYVML
jgi:hypothetical protein